MARTIADIQAAIITAKNSEAALNSLTSTSATAIWRLWTWIVAAAIHLHETLWDAYRDEVDAIVAAAIPGTARWYVGQCYAYQHGDELVYIDERFVYEIIDTSKQIVKRASVSESQGIVFLKVAKLVGGAPVKLTAGEYDAFVAYIAQIKFAGTQATVISSDADQLRFAVTIYYDATLLNSDGKLITDTSVEPVRDAVEAYLANITWDGKLYLSALVDAMQAATGVIDVVLTTAEGKAATEASFSAINRVYAPAAGYYTIDDLTITYNV